MTPDKTKQCWNQRPVVFSRHTFSQGYITRHCNWEYNRRLYACVLLYLSREGLLSSHFFHKCFSKQLYSCSSSHLETHSLCVCMFCSSYCVIQCLYSILYSKLDPDTLCLANWHWRNLEMYLLEPLMAWNSKIAWLYVMTMFQGDSGTEGLHSVALYISSYARRVIITLNDLYSFKHQHKAMWGSVKHWHMLPLLSQCVM